jgi:hypothetical protein
MSAPPHVPQNRWLAAFSWPHWEQTVMSVTLTLPPSDPIRQTGGVRCLGVQPTCEGGRDQIGYSALGSMFWFSRKKLSGSTRRLSWTSRSQFGP